MTDKNPYYNSTARLTDIKARIDRQTKDKERQKDLIITQGDRHTQIQGETTIRKYNLG